MMLTGSKGEPDPTKKQEVRGMVEQHLNAAEAIAEVLRDQPGPSTPISRTSSLGSLTSRQLSFSSPATAASTATPSSASPVKPIFFSAVAITPGQPADSPSSPAVATPSKAFKTPELLESALPSKYGGKDSQSDLDNSDDEHHPQDGQLEGRGSERA